MITGSGVFDVRELDDVEQEAQRVACTVMIDQAFADLAALENGEDFAGLTMLDWLPRKHLLRCHSKAWMRAARTVMTSVAATVSAPPTRSTIHR